MFVHLHYVSVIPDARRGPATTTDMVHPTSTARAIASLLHAQKYIYIVVICCGKSMLPTCIVNSLYPRYFLFLSSQVSHIVWSERSIPSLIDGKFISELRSYCCWQLLSAVIMICHHIIYSSTVVSRDRPSGISLIIGYSELMFTASILAVNSLNHLI